MDHAETKNSPPRTTRLLLVDALRGLIIVDPSPDLPGGSRICLFNEPGSVTLAMIQVARK